MLQWGKSGVNSWSIGTEPNPSTHCMWSTEYSDKINDNYFWSLWQGLEWRSRGYRQRHTVISAPAEVVIAYISQKCGFLCKDHDSGGSSVFPCMFLHPVGLLIFLKLSPSLKWRPKGTTHTRLPLFSRRQENQDQRWLRLLSSKPVQLHTSRQGRCKLKCCSCTRVHSAAF